jgi:hypothetical protein
MANAPYSVDFISGFRPARIAQFRGQGNTFNLNQSSTIPLNTTTDRLDEGYSIGTDSIICNFSDWVEVEYSVYFESNSSRSNPGIQIALNGTPFDPESAMGYIRSSSGHNESSETGRFGFNVVAGDEISFQCKQLAGNGGVEMFGSKSVFQVKRNAFVVQQAKTPRRVVWVWAEENGALALNSRQFSFGNGATGGTTGVPVPSNCKLTKMFVSTSTGTGFCNFGIVVNGVVNTSYVIELQDGVLKNKIDFPVPLQLNALDIIDFITGQPGTGRAVCVIGAELEIDL